MCEQVEEVKRMASFVPIMVATIMFNTVYAQMTTVFVEQVSPGCAPLLASHLHSCSYEAAFFR